MVLVLSSFNPPRVASSVNSEDCASAPPMEVSRDTTPSQDEFEDDGGLELSLGLSCGGPRNKSKAAEGSNPSVSLDAVEAGAAGEGISGKPKTGRCNGLDAALKKFLEGRLDDQEESGRLLDGYSQQQGAWELSKGGIRALGSQSAQEKSAVSDLESKGNPGPFKDMQLSASTTWGQLAQQNMPAHFLDALKSGSVVAPTSLLPPHVEALGHGDGEKGEVQRQDVLQQHDVLEQQRRFQEARKKRKYLIEEQKQQKKVKKEDDRIGPHWFRRPGSNTWVHGLDAGASAFDGEREILAPSESEEGEQAQQEIKQERETEQEESTGTPGDDSNGVEVDFMPQLKPQDPAKFPAAGNGDMRGLQGDAWRLRMTQPHAAVNELVDDTGDSALKGVSGTQGGGELSTFPCQKAGSPAAREAGKMSRHSSSTGSDSSEKNEERSCGGDAEASSAPSVSTGIDTTLPSTSSPFVPPVAMSSAALPYNLTSYSVVPMPYSLPVPVPNAPGVPYPVGFSFPYMMQYVPPSSDAPEQSSARPFTSSTFQLPSGQGYPPLQVPPLEGATPRIQGLRPPPGSPFSNMNSGVAYSRNTTGVVEDVNARSQGLTLHENGTEQSPTPATDMPKHHLYRDASSNCIQHPPSGIVQPHQAPGLQLFSSLPLPAVPHFGPVRALSDLGELCSFKDQGGINAFPGFTSSVQGLPGAPRPPPAVVEEGGRTEQSRVGVAAIQQAHRTDDGQETLGGRFHRGSTDNLPVSDALAQELVHLRPGIPSGLKFGGTGSCPDLPWVSTTGPGPNGKTVHGVLYKFSTSQLKIVCACHGKHMSPSEFAQHAGSVEISNPDNNSDNPFPHTSQETSA